jgi:putative MATE family efflux protein
MRIIFVALPFMYGFFFVMAVLRGAGDSKTPFIFLAASVVLDIALNPLLIFGLGPFPKMGIAGSATATLIAQSLSLTALIAHLYRSDHFLCIRGGEMAMFRVDWRIVRVLLVKGLPMGLQMIVVSSSMLVMITFVNRYGSQVTAAFAAAMQLWNYIQMPALALSASVSSMAAQNVGAGRWDRVSKIASTGVAFNFLIGGSLIAIVYLLNAHALGLFLPSVGDALSIATRINATILWSFAFFGVTMVLFGVVRATGATMPPLILLFFSLWVVRIPFAYLLQDRWGQNAVWWSFPASSLVSMLLAISYYRYGGWRSARMGAVAEPAAGAAREPV